MVLAVAACGSDDGPDATETGAGTETTTTASTTTTSTTSTTLVVPRPTVLVAGDSMVYDVTPAIEAALEPDVAEVVPVVAPTLGTEANRTTLVDQIETADVDVAIIMVGVWESRHVTASGATLGEPAFADEYPGEALEPIRESLAAVGGRLLISGPPPLRVEADEATIEALEAIWQSYAAAHDDVDFVDSDDWLGGGGIYVDFDAPSGVVDAASPRLRRADRIHLCVEGARRIAKGMLDAIAPELDGRPPIDPAWEQGAWTALIPEDECPAGG
jgi:hypothetical protein